MTRYVATVGTSTEWGPVIASLGEWVNGERTWKDVEETGSQEE